MIKYSSRYWLDSLVDIQSSKSADVRARTFDTLRRLSKVVKERETKHKRRGVTVRYFHLYACVYMHAPSVSFVIFFVIITYDNVLLHWKTIMSCI